MRYTRHNVILELIEENDIETQEKLASMLNERGFNVTQATVSRDIKELRLIKILTPSGNYKYAQRKELDAPISDRFARIFRETVTDIKYSGNLIVVKTLSGCANACLLYTSSLLIICEFLIYTPSAKLIMHTHRIFVNTYSVFHFFSH